MFFVVVVCTSAVYKTPNLKQPSFLLGKENTTLLSNRIKSQQWEWSIFSSKTFCFADFRLFKSFLLHLSLKPLYFWSFLLCMLETFGLFQRRQTTNKYKFPAALLSVNSIYH
jgi:hypothetical protein